MTYNELEEIVAANKEIDHHFFDRSTMRFFDSIIYPKIYNGNLFISSEKFGHEYPRLYTIRKATKNGEIETVSKFQEFETYEQAEAAIKGKT